MSKICKFFSTKNKAIIALGSNMGNRFKNLSTAADLLSRVNKIVKTSQIYENPSYDNNQILLKENMFFNAAVQIETELNCEELLQYCKAIERVILELHLGLRKRKENE